MANAGFPGSGFKPETIEFVIATIQDFWSDRSEEKLEALFGHLKFHGITSEKCVEFIDEEDLEELIGDEPARIILEHFTKPSTNNCHSKPAPHDSRDHKPTGYARQSDGADDSRALVQSTAGDQNQMAQMFQMFLNVQVSEGKKNRAMMNKLQGRMEGALERVTDNIMTSMKSMNDKLTCQIELQRDLLGKMGGRIVAMEQRHQEMASKTQEWMENTQKMNNQVIMELTRKVNQALEAKEEVRKQCSRDESESSGCTIL